MITEDIAKAAKRQKPKTSKTTMEHGIESIDCESVTAALNPKPFPSHLFGQIVLPVNYRIFSGNECLNASESVARRAACMRTELTT
jgi:hypothetical protein